MAVGERRPGCCLCRGAASRPALLLVVSIAGVVDARLGERERRDENAAPRAAASLAAAHGDHAAAARGDDHDAAAPGPAARRARGAQFERAHEFVEHGAGFELGERGADAAADAAAEGQPRARGWARTPGIGPPATPTDARRRPAADARAGCTRRRSRPPAAAIRRSSSGRAAASGSPAARADEGAASR